MLLPSFSAEFSTRANKAGGPKPITGSGALHAAVSAPSIHSQASKYRHGEKRLSHLNKSSRFAQRLQHPRRWQKFKSEICVALLGVLVQQTLAADPCAVWDRLATGTCHCFERSLEGSVTANVASAPAPVATTDGPSSSKAVTLWGGRPTVGDADLLFPWQRKLLVCLPYCPDDGENGDIVDSTDRAALVPGLTNAGTMHVKHQHLINNLSFIYSFQSPS